MPPRFLATLSASIAGSVGNPTILNLSKPEFLVCDVVDATGFLRLSSVLRPVSVVDLPTSRSPKRLKNESVSASDTVEAPTDPVGTLTVFDLPAFEFLVSEPASTSDPVVSLNVLDLPRPEPPMGELLGISDPVGNLTRFCLPASKILERESAGGSSSEEAGTVTDLITSGSLVSEPVALILPVLSLPMSIRPCSRYGRGCQGKKVSRQRGQLLLSRSQVTMHAEPTLWPQDRRTSALITPVVVFSVL